MKPKLCCGAVADLNALQEAAVAGYNDGITVLALIETIERSNDFAIIKAINAAEAGNASRLFREAAFFRLHILIVRAFAPVRHSDDLHLRAAINFLRQPGRIDEETWQERRDDLAEAIRLFDEADNDPRLGTLRHMRDKQLAHFARIDESKGRSTYADLFGLGRATAAIWERLSFGAGTAMIDIDKQVDAYREAADAFWRRWKTQ